RDMARDIRARDIRARDIRARDIRARDIPARYPIENDGTDAAVSASLAIGHRIISLVDTRRTGLISGPKSRRSSKLRLSLASPPVRCNASDRLPKSTFR